ncbi:MAG: sulfotransferase [Candidatus Marinimicrobia bacterium]|jgi:hypothetical protein|nr:sulfotransferase [Candidatus Neomarinimicrobiota bacterium]MBT4851029.1 sulfotransferase [Candidatus Neomarinimicrobiota bacterium]MBT6713615.1 sulfotransferase [Candidatus Neomarinimicrobiota bacterium]MBT7021626.1 sulfotransferase [Candidatus Neomarinimicrobiota bacterium]MBT7884643.1 sulfotransferase [Candidatus Neomarinimicrobiota bacterium]
MGKPPIIIIGMHRSGTTMLAKFLGELGVFMGNDKEKNYESKFFQKLNKWMLSVAGCSWDNPDGFGLLLDNRDILSIINSRIENTVNSLFLYQFFGAFKFIKNRSLFNLNSPWGWKDPRTTITLPIWLKLFPNAKIIYITRHGVDVANSLYTREMRFIKDNQNYLLTQFNQRLTSILPIIRGGIVSSTVCQTFDRSFGLWMRYMEIGEGHVAKYNDSILTIRYESLLENPDEILNQILTFSDIEAEDEKIQELCNRIKKNRNKAYRNDDKLMEYAKLKSPELSRFGY